MKMGKKGILDKTTGQVEERLFKIIVGASRNVVVLKILLSVESNVLGFDFSVFDVNLVSTDDHGNIFTDTNNVSVPIWDVLVSQPGGHVEHDDCTLALDARRVS